MLKNLRVGTKLVVILVAPLVALGVLAGVGVVDRLNNASAARRAGHVGVLVNRDAEAAQALQLEQIWAAVVLNTTGDDSRNTYRDLVKQSDASLAELQKAQDQLGSVSGDLADRLVTVRDRVAVLGKVRSSVLDRSGNQGQVFDEYHLTLDSLNGVFEGAATQPLAPGITTYLNFLSVLARGKGSTADSFTHLAGIAAAGQVNSDRTDLTTAGTEQSEASRRYTTFFEQADTQFKALLRNAQSSAAARSADDLGQQLLTMPPGQVRTTVDASRFVDLATQRLQGELGVQREIARQLLAQATSAESKATSTVRLYLLGTSLGILAALGLAFLVARATVRPLRQLTDAANQLAGQQLPRLVERLRDPDADSGSVRLAAIPISSRDEIGQLAKAFNDIQQVTTEVADEQTNLLRKGISDIFVNLARRNQALLDRQIEFIDQLESNEADPDQLQNLFRLDHLATRMRRNAESLLVLAGAEPPRRRGRPVPLADVVRVAIGEVEDFARVNLLALDDVSVAANVAVDLSHVVAELMDNATQFSPPETLVEVVGHRTRDDSYVLSVSDQGIGMSAEQLTEANQQLAQPPLMGLSLGRSLGFIVISRLAARHGISVRLTSSPSGGITALVTMPANLLGEAAAALEKIPAALVPPGRRGARPVDAPLGADGADADGAPAAPPVPGHLVPEPVLVGSVSNGHATSDLPPLHLPTVTALSEERAASSTLSPRARAGEDNNNEAAATVHSEEPSQPVAEKVPDGAFDPIAAREGGVPLGAPHPGSSDGGEAFTYNDVGEAEQALPQMISRLGSRPAVGERSDMPDAGGRSRPGDGATGGVTGEAARGAPLGGERSAEEPAEPTSTGVEERASGRPVDEAEVIPPAGDAGDTPFGSGFGGFALPRRTASPSGERPPTSQAAASTPLSVPSTRPTAPAAAETVEALPAEASVVGGPGAEQSKAETVSSAPSSGDPVSTRSTFAGNGPGGNNAAPLGPRPGELTAAGLVRRSPKQQIRDLTAVQAGTESSARVVGSQRSPEEVRRMLSRYRTGLQRGRSSTQHGAPTTAGSTTSEGVREGAEASGNGPSAEEDHR